METEFEPQPLSVDLREFFERHDPSEFPSYARGEWSRRNLEALIADIEWWEKQPS